MAKEPKVYEYCIDDDKVAHFHCRLCGCPLCKKCFNHHDGMCSACREIYEEDNDNNADD